VANGDDYYSDEDYDTYGNLLDQGVDPEEWTTIYNYDGTVLIEGTFSEIYEETLQTAEEFEALYGDYTITDLINDLEIAFDIEWDWDTWRSLYG